MWQDVAGFAALHIKFQSDPLPGIALSIDEAAGFDNGTRWAGAGVQTRSPETSSRMILAMIPQSSFENVNGRRMSRSPAMT